MVAEPTCSTVPVLARLDPRLEFADPLAQSRRLAVNGILKSRHGLLQL